MGAAFSALSFIVAILPFPSGANTQELVEIGRNEGQSRSSIARWRGYQTIVLYKGDIASSDVGI